MAAVAGTGTSLSASYYLRNFYTANRNAVTSSKRKEMTGGTLSQADATALHRAAKKLRNLIMRMTLQTVPIFTEASTHLYKFTITRCHPEIKQMTLL